MTSLKKVPDEGFRRNIWEVVAPQPSHIFRQETRLMAFRSRVTRNKPDLARV